MSGSNYWGDLGDEAAEKLRSEQISNIKEDSQEMENEGRRVTGLEKAGLFSKLEFRWKQEDQLFLDRVRVAATVVTSNEYGALQRTLDTLYEGIRVPRLSANGNVILDEKGRVVWEKEEDGRPVEDWSRMDGADLEVAIFNLQRSKIEMSARVNELLQEAIFSKHILNDEYYEGYRSLVEGTQGDRAAQANRVTREDKYFAFYKYCLWSSADTLLKEIAGLQRVMEKIRDWKMWSQKS